MVSDIFRINVFRVGILLIYTRSDIKVHLSLLSKNQNKNKQLSCYIHFIAFGLVNFSSGKCRRAKSRNHFLLFANRHFPPINHNYCAIEFYCACRAAKNIARHDIFHLKWQPWKEYRLHCQCNSLPNLKGFLWSKI